MSLVKAYFRKEGMLTWFTPQGERVAATALRLVEHVFVSPKVANGEIRAQVKVCPAGPPKLGQPIYSLRSGQFIKEIGSSDLSSAAVGGSLEFSGFEAGQHVVVTGQSKGKGFAGSVKRYGFAGGPASHGSKFHRQPGSSGNRTWPGRVMPGKKFPGHLGAETVTLKNLDVLEYKKDDGILVLKGAVPGSTNSVLLVGKV